MSKNIVVAGGGAFGTALAIVMSADEIANVTLLMRDETNAAQMQSLRINQSRLPDVKVPDALSITSDVSCVETADILLSVVPTGSQLRFADQIKPHFQYKHVF